MLGHYALWLLTAITLSHGMPTDNGQWIVLTSSDPAEMLSAAENVDYYGTYNSRKPFSIFKTDSTSLDYLNSGTVVFTNDNPNSHSLVWVEEVVAEGTLRDSELDFETSLDAFMTPQPIQEGQLVLNTQVQPRGTVLWQSPHGAIISIPTKSLSTLDTFLPHLWEVVHIPSQPFPKPTLTETESDKRLRKILSKLIFNPDVASILSGISLAQMSFDIRYLTGEAADSPLISRHSFSDGSRVAAAWLKGKFEEYGAKCHFMEFLDGFAPNVICKYAARPSDSPEEEDVKKPRVIISAHYDSRGTFGSLAAPGGDDDGSGVTQILAIARAIYRKNVAFNTDVELVAFAGEEQGLLGSHAYAKKLYEDEADIVLMIQADMLAYHDADEPLQLGLPEVIGSAVASQLVANISSIYAPELTVGTTLACCSDHQSFWQYGFSSTQVFERAGPIIDPFYHNSGDVSNRTNYDLDQVHAIAKVTFATLLHTAGFILGS